MYSPYPATLAFACIQAVFFLVATIMQSCPITEGNLKKFYYVIMTIMVLASVLMLFSIAIGVGASGYDTNVKNCYLLQE